MDRRPAQDLVPLVDAALSLRIPYQAAWALMLRGTLAGVRQGHRWFVTAESLAAFEGTRAETARVA